MESQQAKLEQILRSKKTAVKPSKIDSSSSLAFDSGTDIGYKSGEISAVQTPTESQPSKTEQNLRFDSGLGTDSFSPVNSETYPPFADDVPGITICKGDKQLNESVEEIYSQDKDGDTILHLAIAEARSDVIFPLIRLAPVPDLLDIGNDLNQTPLLLAALMGKPHVVRRLVVAGAALDLQDLRGNTALHIACHKGDLDCVQAILEPIKAAEISDAHCLYKIFLNEQSLAHLINTRNFEGQTCIHLAAFGGFKKVLECLHDHGGDINSREGKSGKTALHYAVERGNYDLVCLLLARCRANPLVVNYAGQSSFRIACALSKKASSRSRLAILEVLKKNNGRQLTPSESESSSDEMDSCECVTRPNHP